METLTATDTAKKLGVPDSTLIGWARRVGVGTHSSMKAWRFNAQEIAVLELVRNLREADSGFGTITRRVNEFRQLTAPANNEPPTVATGEEEEQHQAATPHTEPQQPATPMDAYALSEMLRTELTVVIRNESDLAQRYATAAHEIGRLEAENKNLLADNQRLLGQVEASKQQQPTPTATPWWRKLFGG